MTENQNTYNESRNLPTYSQSHIGPGRGDTYDQKMYGQHTESSAIWQLEKSILSRIIAGEEKKQYLDFACGTGRVAEYLEHSFEKSYGFDISADMIETARKKVKKTDLSVKNILRDDVTQFLNTFDVITCFRFFLNAEPELKVTVLRALVPLLRDSGCLVFNVHQHSRSLNYVIEKIRHVFTRHPHGKPGNWMSMSEIRSLVQDSGLTIVETYSYAFLPHALAKYISPRIWLMIERFLISKNVHWASHCLILCRKTNT